MDGRERTDRFGDGFGDDGRTNDDAVATTPRAAAAVPPRDTEAERERFGGVKVGSAFFGWLAAMGMAVILTALVAAAGTAVGVSRGTSAAEVSTEAGRNVTTIGVVGAVVVAVVLFVSYYCGGYVAGRMARFNGARQGLAVWVWALVIAIVAAAVTAAVGSRYDVLSQLNSFPRIPVSEGDLTTAGIIALVLAALTSLAGAVLGGMAGMRFHRRVDRADLTEQRY